MKQFRLVRLAKIIFWEVTRLKGSPSVLVLVLCDCVTSVPYTETWGDCVKIFLRDPLILFYDSMKINLRHFYENCILAFSVDKYKYMLCIFVPP